MRVHTDLYMHTGMTSCTCIGLHVTSGKNQSLGFSNVNVASMAIQFIEPGARSKLAHGVVSIEQLDQVVTRQQTCPGLSICSVTGYHM